MYVTCTVLRQREEKKRAIATCINGVAKDGAVPVIPLASTVTHDSFRRQRQPCQPTDCLGSLASTYHLIQTEMLAAAVLEDQRLPSSEPPSLTPS